MKTVESETVLADPRALERAMQRAGVSTTAMRFELGAGAEKALLNARNGRRIRFLTLDKVACMLGTHVVELLEDPNVIIRERWLI